MARDWVAARIRDLLAFSGRTDKQVVIGYTYRALAARVYRTDEPTAAQLSAVRRAVARLVAQGEAMRDAQLWAGVYRNRPPTAPARAPESRPRPTVAPRVQPAWTVVFRVPTEADRAAREEWERRREDQD